MRTLFPRSLLLTLCLVLAACNQDDPDDTPADDGKDDGKEPEQPAPKLRDWDCEASGEDAPDFLNRIGCDDDFDKLASAPLDTAIPGARSLKVVLDQADGDAIYFQNSEKYRVHYEFASAHLSGNDLPFVPTIAEFNMTEYYAPDRRFLLGALTYYEGPKVWVLELAPYDTASPEMIAKLYRAAADATFFGPALRFHPTSDTLERLARDELDSSIPVLTTDELYDEIDYQPLNLGTTIGRLRFMSAADLDTEYVSFRDIVVLDNVPNDISVVSGLITEEFQTPLSHVNVLSQNRKTPNMGLKGATKNDSLRKLEGAWVKLHVGAFDYEIEEVSSDEADAFWEANKPAAVGVPRLDLSVTELRDIEDLTQEEVDGEAVPLKDAVKAAIPAFGGKASHFSILAKTEGVPTPKAFSVPVYFYSQFLEQNGFAERIDAMLEDPEFIDDPAVRAAQLETLRGDMMVGAVDEGFQEMLRQKLDEFPEDRIRFRSSTNAEDLDGFTGAGLYTSKTGDKQDWDDVLDAVREVWSSVWYFRAFEERSYRSIDHRAVGMALLVHHSFPDEFEAANGVALTANPFDPSMLEPGFYVNVQLGAASVVQPDAGVTTDQFVYHFTMPGMPVVYLSRSSLTAEGTSVLTTSQIYELGKGLDAVHKRFAPAYGRASGNDGWYAMDVEFKFYFHDPEADEPDLVIKQARPHPGRGQ